MNTQQISDIIGDVQMATIKGHCYDCQAPVNVVIERTGETQMNISGGALFQTPVSWDMGDELFCKCDACFEKRHGLGRKTLVYSRICGYLTPTKQWHNAKQGEFEIRKTFRPSKFLDNN